VDVEWTPIVEEPSQPPDPSPSASAPPLDVRLRRRAAAQAPTAAPATASGRCLVCGSATTMRPIRVGPFKAPLCTFHATTVHVGAMLMKKLIGG